MNLVTMMERWRTCWRETSDPAEIERHLKRLEWLQEFVFHCGSAIPAEYVRALHYQIQAGERRLAELTGDKPEAA
jgi:hypothetical protein